MRIASLFEEAGILSARFIDGCRQHLVQVHDDDIVDTKVGWFPTAGAKTAVQPLFGAVRPRRFAWFSGSANISTVGANTDSALCVTGGGGAAAAG